MQSASPMILMLIIQACSTMDCTGLIPALPETEAEQEAYEDLYPYITRAKNIAEDK